MTATDTLLGWHWLPADRCLRYDDGREPRVGETLTVDGTPDLCNHGLHASERAIDSLKYAPGPIVCRVVLSGEIVRGADKAAATRRTPLAMADATRALGEWSCDCADRALQREREAGREPDPRSWAALTAKRRWLRGAASDAELDVARAAAWDAAWAAAGAAAGDAARDAAGDAARGAAWAAELDAAWDAALAAAGDAAWGAARGAARDAAWAASRAAELAAAWDTARTAAWDAARAEAWAAACAVSQDASRDAACAVPQDASRDAAWAAARDAEREWQNAHLEEMLLALLGLESEATLAD